MAFTLNLMVIGAIREFLGTGQLAIGSLVFPKAPLFEPAVVMLTPPGGFITLGVLMALLNIVVARAGKRKQTESPRG